MQTGKKLFLPRKLEACTALDGWLHEHQQHKCGVEYAFFFLDLSPVIIATNTIQLNWKCCVLCSSALFTGVYTERGKLYIHPKGLDGRN